MDESTRAMSTSFSDIRGSRRGSTASTASTTLSSSDDNHRGPSGQRRGSLDRTGPISRPRTGSNTVTFVNGKLATIPDVGTESAGRTAAADAATDDEGRGCEPLFRACLQKNFDVLDSASIGPRGQFYTDKSGNSLLHAMFMLDDTVEVRKGFDLDRFAKIVLKLIKAGIDPGLENANKRSCLLGTELEQSTLKKVLLRFACSDLRQTFSKLQRNSEGLHAVHVFCRRYEISELLSALGQLYDLSPDQLLNLRPNSDVMSGATCLHFACQAGNEQNIKFLLEKGLKLTTETADGLNCIDFASNTKELPALTKAAVDAGQDLRETLRLIDLAKRALELPDEASARSLLSVYRGPLSKIAKDEKKKKKDKKKSETSAEQQKDGQSDKGFACESAEARLLYKALELDSSEILKSLVALDQCSDDLNPQLVGILQRRVKEAGGVSKLDRFAHVESPDVTLLRHPKAALIDCAVTFEKAALLPDIMVLAQFDIIPQTLRVLILLKSKIKLGHGRQEDLEDVKTVALNILINVMEQLYTNANKEERQLLFRYLSGDFKDSQGVRGPKFLNPQCLYVEGKSDSAKTDFASVVDLIDVVNNAELHGTDCMSKLVDHYWNTTPPLPWLLGQEETESQKEDNTESDKGDGKSSCQKSRCGGLKCSTIFILNCIMFAAFLIFFAWYLMDFGRSLHSTAADVIMWHCALSLTMQEANNIANLIAIRVVYFHGHRFRVPKYFAHTRNYLNLCAVALMWCGLGTKLKARQDDSDLVLTSQRILGASFLLWMFHLLNVYNFFKVTGAKLSMFSKLLYREFWPYANFMLIIVMSFGIFFHNLLFPVPPGGGAGGGSRSADEVLKQIFSLPMDLMHGYYEKDYYEVCNTTSYLAEGDCVDSAGFSAFHGFFQFLFLTTVNVVMTNLLIALFNQSVSRLDAVAVAIWRRNRFKMLGHFSDASPMPVPASFLHYSWKLGKKIHKSKKRSENQVSDGSEDVKKKEPWWKSQDSFERYPEGYRAFLTYQAQQLRLSRPELRRCVEKNRTDADALKAFVENQLAQLRSELSSDTSDRVEKLRDQMMELLGRNARH